MTAQEVFDKKWPETINLFLTIYKFTLEMKIILQLTLKSICRNYCLIFSKRKL